MAIVPPFNFKQWIDDNRHLLKPPVGNKCVYTEADDFIVMVVGGPNARKDYHYNEGEEFFFQIEGDIVLRVIDDGTPVDIPIKEGEIFLLPAKVPHSPQRPANTIGLVIERIRDASDTDGLMWFCEACGSQLHEEMFHLEDIASQLPPIMDRFYSAEDHRTCDKCGETMSIPVKH